MKNVIAALALAISIPALGDTGEYDVGVAGVDYEKLIDPVEINVIRNNSKLRKSCGKAAQGCAMTSKRMYRDMDTGEIVKTEYVCNVFLKVHADDITLRHEMKHCYGWAHEEMPKSVQRDHGPVQRLWLDKAHKSWAPTNFSK